MIIKEINIDDYLAFYKNGEELSLFYQINWLNSVSEAYSLEWQLLGCFSKDQLIIAFPVNIRKLFSIIKIAGSPLPGIGAAITPISFFKETEVEVFIRAVEKWAKSQRIFYFNLYMPITSNSLTFSSYVEHEWVDNLELPLEKPLEELWRGIKSEARNRIRKAVRNGVKVHWFKTKDSIQIYWKLIESTYNNHQQIKPLISREMCEATYNNLLDNGLKIIGATYQGHVIAMLWIMYDGNRCYFWNGASNQQLRHLNANHLLHWEIIKWGKRKGIKVYDLFGRAKKSGIGGHRPGIARFKKSLGGKRVNYMKVLICPAWLRIGISIYRKILAMKYMPKRSEKS